MLTDAHNPKISGNQQPPPQLAPSFLLPPAFWPFGDSGRQNWVVLEAHWIPPSI